MPAALAEIGPVDEVIRRPLHPYTSGLIGSIPSLHRQVGELVQIDGAMPRLDAMPNGCSFHPRCAQAFAPCASRAAGALGPRPSAAACWLHRPDDRHGP